MTHAYAFPDFAAPAPVRCPHAVVTLEPVARTAPVSRLDRAGELVAALVVIAGGAALVGFASLL